MTKGASNTELQVLKECASSHCLKFSPLVDAFWLRLQFSVLESQGNIKLFKMKLWFVAAILISVAFPSGKWFHRKMHFLSTSFRIAASNCKAKPSSKKNVRFATSAVKQRVKFCYISIYRNWNENVGVTKIASSLQTETNTRDRKCQPIFDARYKDITLSLTILIHDLNFDKNRTLLPVMNLSFVTDLNLFALKVSILWLANLPRLLY